MSLEVGGATDPEKLEVSLPVWGLLTLATHRTYLPALGLPLQPIHEEPAQFLDWSVSAFSILGRFLPVLHLRKHQEIIFTATMASICFHIFFPLEPSKGCQTPGIDTH